MCISVSQQLVTMDMFFSVGARVPLCMHAEMGATCREVKWTSSWLTQSQALGVCLFMFIYRDAATATNKHYDTHKFPGHVHKNRFLLKAQPQQGKTGAAHGQATMQDAWCLLCRWSMISMQTWLVLGSAHFNVIRADC